MHVLGAPSWFTGADGKVHLTYELELVNGFPVDVSVSDVEVCDAATHDPIARLAGNTGSSTGSHLHFHVMDRPSALRANGLPYVFDRFTLDGRGPSVEEIVKLDPVLDTVPITHGPIDGARHDELPLGSDVVTFPTPKRSTPGS